MRRWSAATGAVAAVGLWFGVAPAADAATVSVTSYNWLQLAPASVTPSIGGNPAGGSGYGSPDAFRWGGHVWIPNGTLTDSGSATYWAAVQLDRPRLIENVWVQWWTGEGTSLTRYFIDGSNDGSNWTQIGIWSGSNPAIRTRHNINVTDGTYEYVRVRLDPGDYTTDRSHRGGPGLYAIEPMGAGDITLGQKVNWLNEPNFNTGIYNNGLHFNGLRYNDGFFDDTVAGRTGTLADWEPDEWIRMDLGAERLVDEIIMLWERQYHSTAFTISYSDQLNGVYTAVTPLIGPNLYAATGATGYTFARVTAQYWQISYVQEGHSYSIFTQVLVLGTVIPEPASLVLLAVASLGLPSRRRVKQPSPTPTGEACATAPGRSGSRAGRS